MRWHSPVSYLCWCCCWSVSQLIQQFERLSKGVQGVWCRCHGALKERHCNCHTSCIMQFLNQRQGQEHLTVPGMDWAGLLLRGPKFSFQEKLWRSRSESLEGEWRETESKSSGAAELICGSWWWLVHHLPTATQPPHGLLTALVTVLPELMDEWKMKTFFSSTFFHAQLWTSSVVRIHVWSVLFQPHWHLLANRAADRIITV